MFDKKQRRMNKIIRPDTKKGLLLAFDHGVEHGPSEYDGINLDPLRVARIAYEGQADALIVHAGSARYIRKFTKRVPLIIKITARTHLSPNMVQTITTTVKEAEYLGAYGVAATVYIGSEEEDEMLENLCEIKQECIERQMPLIGFMYPRVEGRSKNETSIVRYAARVGAELGVDVVKTYYTGSPETFKKVVKDANFVPVVAAGGGIKESATVMATVKDVMSTGAAGMAIGRNVWAKKNGVTILKEIRKRIHGGYW
jgi:DhnA family fructose-bisphosphate aldolase class Ia